MAIVLNGSLSDWTAADRLEKSGTTVANHEVFGRFEDGKFYFALNSAAPVGHNTTLWLNTDRNSQTGEQVFGAATGADFRIEFDADGTPMLINAILGGATLPLTFARSEDGRILEFELDPAQIGNAGAVTFALDINDGPHLPESYFVGGYTVVDPAANPLDGSLDEWTRSDRIDTPLTARQGYEVFGAAADGIFQLALKAPGPIGNGTTFWLNTDNNTATGTPIFDIAGVGGAEYRIEVDAGGIARLYTGSGTTPLATLNSMLGSDETTLELSVPKALVGNTSRLDIFIDVNNNNDGFIPGSYFGPGLTLVDDPGAQVPETGERKIAIVYSATTAAQFFSPMAYSQLFMSAQNQAMAAGIPFDVIDEDDLTDLAKLSQYDALVFPSFRNVPANHAAIQETLTRLVYDYDVSLITAGDFMTNDATGAALPDAYARMHLLLGLERVGGSNGNVEVKVVAGPDGHPVTEGYAPGATIHNYASIGTSYFGAVNEAYTPTTTIASQVVDSATHDAVVGTVTGGKNVHFATESLLGDSNLLGKALDWVTSTGSGPTVSLHMSRNSSIVASRNDMDQSQESYDVDGEGNGGIGIYDVLLPILQSWKEQYNFVGSYYVNVGANPPDQETNWLISKFYYDQLLAMGNEIGSHSYTHPSDTNFLAGVIDTQEELDAFAALYAQPGNVDGDPAIAAQLASMTLAEYQAALGRGIAAADPAALDALDKAVLTTTFQFQFEKARQVLEEELGINIGGAAVPGMPESLATAREIIQYYEYLSGGASLVGAGYPSAFGYLSADENNKIYLAPNVSFDFTLMGWQNLTVEQAIAAWTAEWNKLNENSDLPVVVWPWHDYGPTEWVIDPPLPSEYREEMFTHFIQMAHGSGAEFVTLADLAARMQAFEKSDFSFSVAGNTITAMATPTSGQVGTFALNLDDLGGQTIRSVANWYAYDEDSVFLDADGGEFQIELGTTTEDVTHITSLDQRMKLVSLYGDGTNLTFTAEGEGIVKVALKDYQGTPFAVTGATLVSQVGDVLTLKLPTLGTHNVGVALVDAAPTGILVSDQITLLENTSSRTKVATIAVSDPDLDPRLRDNAVTVSDDRFVFDETDGGLYLQSGKSVDFEAQSFIDLLLSTGSGASAITKAVQLSVTDVNEAPTSIVVSNQIALAENTTIRTKVADLSVLDPDTSAAFRNNAVAVNDSRFEIADDALYLKAGQTVDFETSSAVELVLSTGSGDDTISKSVRLAIGDVPEDAVSLVLRSFTPSAEGWNSNDRYPRHLADVNGDGSADIVGFGDSGVYVAVANGQGGFNSPSMVLEGFAPAIDGWVSNDRFPRHLADVNGDGSADIVGFGDSGVYVAVANGQGGFNSPSMVLEGFATITDGWVSNDRFPRHLADVNGDGSADIVGFGDSGVFVAVANGQGGFNSPSMVLEGFAPAIDGWVSNDRFPRHLADVNGDGSADIVGFGDSGVYVAVANGQGGFNSPSMVLESFAPAIDGWVSNDRFPRHLADVNGDGSADIVGFGNSGVYVAVANGQGGFNSPTMVLEGFATTTDGWVSNDRFPRHLADVNGDGSADIVGFGDSGVYVAASNDWFA
ncbi:FG-GAP-like repeat-containing protein [Devosia albogilva]|uniref:FG-GAP-like repeat-containing protein n=1 Tax=Devosia albogilva TaxID=429726 RepID=A0ABW5QM31_9HYPH